MLLPSALLIHLASSAGFVHRRTPINRVRISVRHGWAVVVEPNPTHPVCVKGLQDILHEPWEKLHGREQAAPVVVEDDDLGLDLRDEGNRLGPLPAQPIDELEQMHRNWLGFVAIGVVLILVGAAAISYPVAATITTVGLATK